jgi:NTP pyrophosphatase (non-canonical NTP hydrolase)
MTFNEQSPTKHTLLTSILNDLARECHAQAHRSGFYTADLEDCPRWPRCHHLSGGAVAQLMLVVTELSEAVEVLRTTQTEEGDFDCPALEDEIADAFVRLFDFCGALRLDIGTAIPRVMQRNAQRPPRHNKEF